MDEDEAANEIFDALYRASIDRVYFYARARLGPDEAEDVASEVFTAALLALERGNGSSVTEGWLMSVTRNKVVDRWRAAHRRMLKRHLFVQPAQVDTGPSGLALDGVTLALDQLSLKHRSVLVLHYLDGYPMAEVADLLGVSLEAARSSIARARRSFKSVYAGVLSDARP